MNNPLLRKLANFTELSEEESQAVLDCCGDVREVGAREDVITQGDRTGGVKLLLDGFACRYKTLEDGRRQIVAYFVPGDLCDLRVFILKRMDHSIGAIAPSRIATISPADILRLTHTYPTLTRALWWSTLVEEAVLREWIVNVGQRPAPARLAHVIVELRERLKVIGRIEGNSFEMPLTQEQIGEALGITAVHANRVIKQLRQDGIVAFHRGRVEVLDDGKLLELAGFDGRYLHLSPAL